MNMGNKLWLMICMLMFAIASADICFAQVLPCNPSPNFGNLQIVGDDINICGDGVHLQVQFTPGTDSFPPSTDSYVVIQNNVFAPEPWIGPNSFNIQIDDVWLNAPFSLPVCFSFFGKKYQKCLIGPNGQISFDTTLAGQLGLWPINGPLPLNNVNLNNTINGPFHDLLPTPTASPNGHVTWGVYGTAPCRRFVVSFDSVSYFFCNNIFARHQIVLHEATNEITVNIQSKPICFTWNSGLAIEGIQNIDATKAYTVPGRNATQWTVTNDSWSFVPAGNKVPNFVTYWIDSATNMVLDSGLTFDYWPTQNMTVYVLMSDTASCLEFKSPYKRIYYSNTGNFFSYVPTSFCGQTQVAFSGILCNATALTSYFWSFGDGTTDSTNNPSPVHYYTGTGPYIVTLTTVDNNIVNTYVDTLSFQSLVLNANFSVNKNYSCSASDPIIFTNTSSGVGLNSTWDFGDGNFISTNSSPIQHQYNSVDSFFVTLTVTDTFGCIDTQGIIIYHMPVNSNFTGSINFGCSIDSVVLQNNSTNANNYFWSFGDGTNSAQANPLHEYTSQNVYLVTLVASNSYCADTSSQNYSLIHPINATFNVVDDSVCLGTAMTTINSSVGGGLSYVWDMGDGNTYTSINTNHLYQTGGVYTITLTIQDSIGCVRTASKTIFVDGPAFASFKSSSNTTCTFTMISAEDNISSFAKRWVYHFGNGDSVVNQHNPSFGYSQPGLYTVDLVSEYMVCPSTYYSEQIQVYQHPEVNLGPDRTICPGRDQVTLTDDQNPGANYLWNDFSTGNSITTSSPGVYYVEVSYGPCKGIDSVRIAGSLDCLFIPNAFSPNGDNKNDYFKPYFYSLQDVSHFTMRIFNRWGNEVYTSYSKEDIGWDGNYKGTALAPASFTYVFDIELIDGTKKQFKGDVTLVR